MATKQSNERTQSVKVVVNNKISCNPCNKKKRKPKKKQQAPEHPIDEFPVLNTPANSRFPHGGIAPMAVRNTVYIPNSSQISPEGMQYPIPSYFDRQYTNLTRTMEDFRDSMMKEIDDVRQTMAVEPPTILTNDTQTEPMFQEQQSPVKQIINQFESLGNNEEDTFVPVVEEEAFVSESPGQSQSYKEYKRLYDIRDDSEDKKDIDTEIRDFAQSLGVNTHNENGRLRNVSHMRNDIKKRIKEMN